MNEATYRQYVEDVWNAHNPAALERYFAPDVRVHSFTPGIAPVVGLANLQALAQSLFRVKDGKIVEHWANVDQLGMLQQLGLIPAPGQGK